jgi:nucleotide-binding universal stress UspA family protein
VGIDGSEGSRRALRWSIEQARMAGAAVCAVIVWQRTFDYGRQRYWPADEEIAEGARKRLAATIAEVAGQNPAVEIEPVVLEGDPGQTLCRRSSGADLLVVGSRGHGGFGRLALGSVSTKCAHHSRCPVVIVPRADKPQDPA